MYVHKYPHTYMFNNFPYNVKHTVDFGEDHDYARKFEDDFTIKRNYSLSLKNVEKFGPSFHSNRHAIRSPYSRDSRSKCVRFPLNGEMSNSYADYFFE